MIDILLVEDHQLLRDGLARLLEIESDMRLVGQTGDGQQAVDLAARLRPSIVLMDLMLPVMGGLQATRAILELHPEARVIIISAQHDTPLVRSLFEAGAAGYLVKDCAAEELIDAIRVVSSGGRYLSNTLSQSLIADHADLASSRSLSQREREVLRLVAEGVSMKEAAAQLQLSTKTIETHRRNVMEKLGIFNIAGLTKHAIREGITSL